MMPARSGSEREQGSVAAELPLPLPALVLALLLGAGALGAAYRQVALQSATAAAAHLLGRGEAQTAAAQMVHAAVPGAAVSSHAPPGLVCVTARAEVVVGHVLRLPIEASGCALDGG